MENYYQKEIECTPRGQLREMQSRRLVDQVKFVWEHVPYYREKMEKAGVKPSDIKGIGFRVVCDVPEDVKAI